MKTFLSLTAPIIPALINHYLPKLLAWLDKQWRQRQGKRRRPNRRKR
jgi:hypothetical protein